MAVVSKKCILNSVFKKLGHHFIIDFENCEKESLRDCEKIRNVFHVAAEKAKCTIVNECFHQFEPFGVSGMTIISESHFSVHSWQEYGYLAIDLFYCGDHVVIENAIDHLKDFFKPQKITINNLDRGLSEKPFDL